MYIRVGRFTVYCNIQSDTYVNYLFIFAIYMCVSIYMCMYYNLTIQIYQIVIYKII